jgi:calreticulin
MIPNPKFTETKPEDWDEEKKGEWKQPPKEIPNPNYVGLWRQRMVKNPAYKGPWRAPMILAPDWVKADELYIFPSLRYVGVDVYQLRSGSIFDNIFVGDDLFEFKRFADRTFYGLQEKEKDAYERLEGDTYSELRPNLRYKLRRKERELIKPKKEEPAPPPKEDVDLPDVDDL